MPQLDLLVVKGNCFPDFYDHRLLLHVFNGFFWYMLFFGSGFVCSTLCLLELLMLLLVAVFVLFHCCIVFHFGNILNLSILLLMNLWVDWGYYEYTFVNILKHVLSSLFVHFFWVWT